LETLLIVNDPPYGTERAYNALRLANSLAARPEDAAIFGERPQHGPAGRALEEVHAGVIRHRLGAGTEGGD